MTAISDIAKELAKEAKEKGICTEWHEQLKRVTDIREFAQMYIKGIDFCLSKDFPSNDYIRKHFKGKVEDYGIFIDTPVNLTNCRYCVALGNTKGEVLVSAYKVSEVFAKHQSKLNITAKNNAFVEIDIFDNAEINVTAQDNSRVHINHYGGKISTDRQGSAQIKITEKNKPTY